MTYAIDLIGAVMSLYNKLKIAFVDDEKTFTLIEPWQNLVMR